ncbi:MAG: type II toxin-antitoxin system HigB family toxin [Micavibrio sp.]|nr:type II toxin-antitoxin system HigB family toxin [Micavibrio sp.]
MRIIARTTLINFWMKHPDCEESLKAWFKVANEAEWESPQAIKEQYKNASIMKDGRVVFNIAGNKYRLVVWINYDYSVIYIRFIGTHKQYDLIDAQTI